MLNRWTVGIGRAYPAQWRKNHKLVQLIKCPAACRGRGCCHYCARIPVNISKRVSEPFLKKTACCKFGWTHTHTPNRESNIRYWSEHWHSWKKAWWAQCEEVTWLIMHFNRRKNMQRKLKGTGERETEGKKNRNREREVWEEKLINVFGVTSTNKQTNKQSMRSCVMTKSRAVPEL